VEGAAAVEFALLVPAIGFVVSGTFDLAQLTNFGQTLDGALRAGAGYATAYPNAPAASITSAIQAYAACLGGQTAANGCFVAGQPAVTFPNAGTFSPPQYCTFDNSTAVVSCDNNAAPCIPALGQCPKHFYVRIQAVWSGLTPFLPQWTGMPTSVTRTLTVRVL
jgi:Flp pilus assembly protein TadG